LLSEIAESVDTTAKECPHISREELEKLCFEGLTDEEIAKRYNTSRYCIMKLRRKYGINKKKLAKCRREERLRKATELIESILRRRGYVTSIELRERYGIKISKELLQRLESTIDGFKWFKLKYVSTRKYSVLPPRFLGSIIMYLKGKECDVLDYLLFNRVGLAPWRAVKSLLRANNAPAELIEKLY